MENSAVFKKVIVLLFALCLSMACKKKQAAPGQNYNSWNLPYFGFNAKGNVDVSQQTSYGTAYFSQIKDESIRKNLVIRVTGGTTSQTNFPQDWTNENINSWVDFQKTQGIRLIYVVNGNDSPASQAQFIQKWLDAGAHFDFIEMMNEYYLTKFTNGNTSSPEVTFPVSPEKYVDSILPAFWTSLDQFQLPYYLIFAPEQPTSANYAALEHWNEVVSNATKSTYLNRNLNATIHLYIQNESDIPNFDYNQIESARNSIPAGRHIAITEAGIINPALSYQQAADIAIEHYKNIIPHLKQGDYLLDQILYNNSANNNTAALNPSFNGETPKGTAMLNFILNRLK